MRVGVAKGFVGAKAIGDILVLKTIGDVLVFRKHQYWQIRKRI